MCSRLFSVLASLVVVSCFSLHAPAKNTVEDAQRQLKMRVRCWEPIDSTNPDGGFKLSEPIFELCSYMPDPKDFTKGYVNGVDMDSDDYSHVLGMFANPIPGYAMVNVCLQEAFQFHAASHPSQTSLRCLCKRDGCNLPKGITAFLEFNKHPMPEVAF